jgi:hypothetical protein
MEESQSNSAKQLFVAALAAFCVYFCMYAFRKPFTAGTFAGQEVFGFALKTVLVVSQLCGYMLAKFLGIKVVSEMPSKYRAVSIVALILIAELALVGFALAPLPLKPLMLFLNGLPLGMIFGLVLAFLEGRKHTEALSSALCASFIISSGVVKSVGRWLIEEQGVSEFDMPMVTGLIFLPALLISVWFLQTTPPPDQQDRRLRTERSEMNRAQRRKFFAAYWPGLTLLVAVYVLLTVIRTIRDDFAVEIWAELGVTETPSIFARSEMVVALSVTALNGFAVCIVHNLSAFRVTILLMCFSFVLVIASALLQFGQVITPFVFMVSCGIGMYIPYVAFHTTVFERLIAISRHPSNLGFLMYLADSIGYLGYALVLVFGATMETSTSALPFFRWTLVIGAALSVVGLVLASIYFRSVLVRETDPTDTR